MIVVHLIGGLGNQLFQYAAGLSLSKHYGTPFKLDTSSFSFYKLHNYSLHHFAVQENIATEQEIFTLKGPKPNLFSKLLTKYTNLNLRPKTYIKEKTLKFDPNIFSINITSFYLDGYWQNEKYFEDVKDLIRASLIIKTQPDKKNQQMSDQIKNCNSVAIHVRRADYVSNKSSKTIHGTCSTDYYDSAVRHVCQKIKSPVFFVFSDDIDWVKSNLSTRKHTTHYMDHNNADKNYEDLRLMSLCKHNIIANSSFSWWGAWLNKNPDKIIIGPKKWFNSGVNSSINIMPDTWLKI